ncbi:lipopolysaccharide biosynthesis protein [Fundidesulfovibrio magnetotacticus]|nr:lipopolysaccharide biosynthesis protein [Fundidesulfovibrio magnetotacticus]
MSIAKSIAWMGCTSALGQVVTWSVTILVARLLTPEDYGLVALSGLFTVFAQSVSELGVGAAVIQRESVTEHQIRSLYGLSLLTGVVMTLIGYLAGPVLAWIFSDERLSNLVAFQSLIFIVAAMKSMQRNVLVRETRFDLIAKVETISRIGTSCCTLAMAATGFGYWALAAQWLLIEFFQFIMFSRIERIRPTLLIRYSEIRDILYFGIGIMVRSIFFQLYALVDTAILGKLATKDFLGAYGFAKQLTNMPFEKIVRIVNQVLYPYLARNQGDISALRELTLKAAEHQALVIAPFYYILFFCADETVSILLGPNWSQAVFPLKIFCVACLFRLAESYNINCMTAMGMIYEQIRYMLTLIIVLSVSITLIAATAGPRYSLFIWITAYPLLSLGFSKALLARLGISFAQVISRLRRIAMIHIALITVMILASSHQYSDNFMALAFKCGAGVGFYIVANMLFNMECLRKLVNNIFPNSSSNRQAA